MIVRVAWRKPAAVDVKVMLTLHELFGCRETAQVVVSLKSPAFGPLIEILASSRTWSPVLVALTTRVALG